MNENERMRENVFLLYTYCEKEISRGKVPWLKQIEIKVDADTILDRKSSCMWT